MNDIVELEKLTPELTSPYVVTRSKLGATTKIIDHKFICGASQLYNLSDSIREKIATFRPTKAGFQYLLSFTDNTHYENNDLSCLENVVENSSKKTEKLILNWEIGHEYSGVENEMSITVRISNPINPIAFLQAVMSKDHNDADSLDFETGSVSVSIHGATQNTAEEIFSLVTRWCERCPNPASITGLNNTIYKHVGKISFINYWVFPIVASLCFYFFLIEAPENMVSELTFLAFVAFMTIRAGSDNLNTIITEWARRSRVFSMFMLTGGDQNQQTKLSALSKNSAIKLFLSVGLSFLLNVVAGLCVGFYLK